MFLQLDGTFFIQLLNFAIFFALLYLVFLGPVSKAIRKRREYLDGLRNDYAAYQAEGNAKREEAERIRADARREAEQRLAKARGEASNEASDLALKYGAQVQATVEDAQAKANAALATAKENEERLVNELASTMVDRALSETAR